MFFPINTGVNTSLSRYLACTLLPNDVPISAALWGKYLCSYTRLWCTVKPLGASGQGKRQSWCEEVREVQAGLLAGYRVLPRMELWTCCLGSQGWGLCATLHPPSPMECLTFPAQVLFLLANLFWAGLEDLDGLNLLSGNPAELRCSRSAHFDVSTVYVKEMDAYAQGLWCLTHI